MTENKMEQYANLLVEVGLALKPGDNLQISCSEQSLPLARLVNRKAYEAGVKNVHLQFSDDQMTLERYLYAKDASFEHYEKYFVDFSEALFKDGYHRLSLAAPNPSLLKTADPKRIRDWSKVVGLASKDLQRYTMEGKVKWCVAAVVSDAWAAEVFPELPLEDAKSRLWDNVSKAVRLDQEDPVEAWKAHDKALKEHEAYLDQAEFEKLIFKGPGTDLEVYLVEGHKWIGGSSRFVDGEDYMANIPTEEIFTMPHADRVNGSIQATKPLYVRGQLVDGFRLTVKDGQVVDFDAEVGKQILSDLLDSDEGARRFGEVALVADNSPISNTGIVFKNTLFDENASCHFALGAAYSENLPGSEAKSEEENRKQGMNDSMIHVDFMVGSKDVTVTGIKKSGEEVILLKDGEWQI